MAFMASATLRDKITRTLVTRATDSNIGSAQQSSSNSASTLLSTLIPIGLYAAIFFILFLVIRNKFPRNYRPRTFLGTIRPNDRSPDLPKGFLAWVKPFFTMSDSYVMQHQSLDGFLLLRFLKISVVICLVGCVITWPILFPVNATGGGGNKQLDILNMSNVKNSYYRYFAHVGCAYIYFGFILYMITRESIYYINLRQAYLLSPSYAGRLSSRTVLFTSIPAPYQNESALRRMLGESVVRVWIASDTKELDELVKRRDKATTKLEGAETKLIKTANGNRLKAEKKGGRTGSDEAGMSQDIENGSSAARYLSAKERPTHRLKPLIGKKVDTIDWCRGEIQEIAPKIDGLQAKHRAHDSKTICAAFVEFTTLAEAQAAYQSLSHHQILHMAPRYTGMVPDEVIWSNLRIKWWERIMRGLVTTSFVTALVIFWSIPVAFCGVLSNINYLTTKLPFLSFINDIPPVILGVVTGLLPSILLSVLMAVLPIILRLVAKLSGDPTLSAVELTTQNYYFSFQVVQVFLVATLSSAASSAVESIITSPASAPNLLATNLPKASNFYFSYFIVQGLGVVASQILAITGVIIFIVLGKLLDKTPRKMYKRWITLAGVGWGTVFPVYTNLLVIAICYSCIAPLVLIFAAIGLWLFWFAWRYNLLFRTNAVIDTKGRCYPRALQHLFVGLYIAEVCLIGLFAIGTAASVGALGPLILMIIFLIFTVLYHLSLNAALAPLINYVPKSLEAEERRLMEEEAADEKGVGNHQATELSPAPHKKPNLLTKFMRPDIYNDYSTMRRIVPLDIEVRYELEEERDAYFQPSIKSQTPLLWIPRDPMGLSKQEIRDTGKVVPITDEGAELDGKNKIIWDAEDGRPPIYQPPVYY